LEQSPIHTRKGGRDVVDVKKEPPRGANWKTGRGEEKSRTGAWGGGGKGCVNMSNQRGGKRGQILIHSGGKGFLEGVSE